MGKKIASCCGVGKEDNETDKATNGILVDGQEHKYDETNEERKRREREEKEYRTVSSYETYRGG